MGNTMAASPRSYGEGEPYEVEFQSEAQKSAFTLRMLEDTKKHETHECTCGSRDSCDQHRRQSGDDDSTRCYETDDSGGGGGAGGESPLMEILNRHIAHSLANVEQTKTFGIGTEKKSLNKPLNNISSSRIRQSGQLGLNSAPTRASDPFSLLCNINFQSAVDTHFNCDEVF